MKEYDGYLVDDNLVIYSKRTKLKLTPYIGTDGYMHVSYRDENQKTHHQRLHVILANCFIPNPNNYKYINHIDQNKLNNDLSNLEWCTNSTNMQQYWDKTEIRRKHRTKVIVTNNNGFYKEYRSIRQLSYELNLDRHKVARILKNEISNKYDYNFLICETTTEKISNV